MFHKSLNVTLGAIVVMMALHGGAYADAVNIGSVIGDTSSPNSNFSVIRMSNDQLFGYYDSSGNNGRWFLLDDQFNLVKSPTNVHGGNKRVGRIGYLDSGVIMQFNTNSGGRDPMHAQTYNHSTASLSSVHGNSSYPNGAFSDTGSYVMHEMPDGVIYQTTNWRYVNWQTPKSNMYIRRSTNGGASFSGWQGLPRIGNEGNVHWDSSIISYDDRLFAFVTADWSHMRVMINEYNTTTHQWGTTHDVAAGDDGSLMINQDTGKLAMAYVSGGQLWAKYSHVDHIGSWSAAELLSDMTGIAGLSSNKTFAGAYDNDAYHFLLASRSDEQRILQWDGDMGWYEALLDKPHGSNYSYWGRLTADGQGNVSVFQAFDDGAMFAQNVEAPLAGAVPAPFGAMAIPALMSWVMWRKRRAG